MLSRMLCFSIAALVAGLGATSASPANAEDSGCLPKWMDVSHPLAAPTLSPDQIARYRRGLHSPEVVGLRTTLDAYVAGMADPLSTKNLSPIPKDVLKEPFGIFNDSPEKDGSFDVSIFFHQHHNNMVDLVIKRFDDLDYYQIKLLAVVPCTADEQHFVLTRYGAVDAAGGA